MATTRKRVLVVDDEPLVVKSLQALLTLEGDYEVLGFTSGRVALEAIRTRPCDVAVSDFLMPEMDGVAFLKEVRRLYVEVPLIILTGYADKESAIRAINEVGLYQYLEKPWKNDDFLQVIEGALNQRLQIHRLQEYARELEARVQQLTRELAARRG
ncbi:MAG: response regulator [Candidatus Rokuibacteriota bacterium]